MSIPLRPELPALPDEMKSLKVDARGYPVPWFVQWFNGKPDHRVVNPKRLDHAMANPVCWVCGGNLGLKVPTFIIGPAGFTNGINSEPPSHPACAGFSIKGCPFLSNPNMKRRRDASYPVPDGQGKSAGIMLEENPGVMALYESISYDLCSDGMGGLLFSLGEPFSRVKWFRSGRRATYQEIVAAFAFAFEQSKGVCTDSLGNRISDLRAAFDKAIGRVPNDDDQKKYDEQLLGRRMSGAEAWEIVTSSGVRFGLLDQGHLDTVKDMLRDGRTWSEIGTAIG